MGSKKRLLAAALALLIAPALTSCGRIVTLYTDGDREAVQALVAPYSERTGTAVDVVYFDDPRDLVDAIKYRSGGEIVTATHNSLYRHADVILSTDKDTGEALMALDALRKYDAAAAGDIPGGARRDGWWYGMAGWAWVLMWNTGLTGAEPSGLMDLAGDEYPKGSVALVNPNYILYYPCGAASILGKDTVNAFLRKLAQQDAQWLAFPAETAQLVAEGKAAVCLTTLAEARRLKDGGAPVDWAVPDQGDGQMGAYVQYNVVAVSAVAQAPEDARALADYLLEPATEKLSVELGLGDVTLRPCGSAAPVVVPLKTDLYAAQQAMQEIGLMLAWFTSVNPEYKGK